MVLMVMVGRLFDGLPLTASIQECENELGSNFVNHQKQAKNIFKALSDRSPKKCSIEHEQYYFHYIIEFGACFLTLCDKSFDKKLAFSFLQNLSEEFFNEYGDRINSKNLRPYPFIEFDSYIQKTKRKFQDNRRSSKVNLLNTELNDIQRIMLKNVEDILARGEKLSDVDLKVQDLRNQSKVFEKNASELNSNSMAAIITGSSLLLFIFIIWYYLL
jgi:vesicle transport protein SEC22